MTAVVDVMAELIKFLPKTLTIANGDSPPCSWADLALDMDHGSAPIYGTLQRMTTRNFGVSKGNRPVEFTEEQVDSIAFVAGTDVYQVSERDIASATSLTATVGGTPSTALVEDTDYELYMSPDYSTVDAIRFLPGGTKPDDGTQFTFTYDHTKVRENQRDRTMQVYRLYMNAKDYTGDSGYVPHSRLSEQALEALEAYLSKNRGAVLAGSIKIHGYQLFPAGSISNSEATSRVLLDLTISRKKDIQGPATVYVGKVNSDTETEG